METADTQFQTALNSFHTVACDNKEIKRDFVEKFVIEQLHQHLLGDKLIPELTAQLNQYIKESEPLPKKYLITSNASTSLKITEKTSLNQSL